MDTDSSDDENEGKILGNTKSKKELVLQKKTFF